MIDEDCTIQVPVRIINATHHGGYFELFLFYRGEGMTTKEAWNRVESELASYGLPARYSSFKSFLNNTWRIRKEVRIWRKTMYSTINIPK